MLDAARPPGATDTQTRVSTLATRGTVPTLWRHQSLGRGVGDGASPSGKGWTQPAGSPGWGREASGLRFSAPPPEGWRAKWGWSCSCWPHMATMGQTQARRQATHSRVSDGPRQPRPAAWAPPQPPPPAGTAGDCGSPTPKPAGWGGAPAWGPRRAQHSLGAAAVSRVRPGGRKRQPRSGPPSPPRSARKAPNVLRDPAPATVSTALRGSGPQVSARPALGDTAAGARAGRVAMAPGRA